MIVIRLIASFVVIGLWLYYAAIRNAAMSLSMGQLAGQQFQNSDAASMSVATQMSFMQLVASVPTLIAVAILLILWWRLIYKFFTE